MSGLRPRHPAKGLRRPGPAMREPAAVQPPPALAPPTKGRRGSGKRLRSAGTDVRLLPQQQERLKADAAAAGMSLPGYLLAGRLDENEAPPRRRPAAAVTVEAVTLARGVVAFKRANNNLNQLAHTGNLLMLYGEEHGAVHTAQIGRQLVQGVVLASSSEFHRSRFCPQASIAPNSNLFEVLFPLRRRCGCVSEFVPGLARLCRLASVWSRTVVYLQEWLRNE
jgi:hypothetical protein